VPHQRQAARIARAAPTGLSARRAWGCDLRRTVAYTPGPLPGGLPATQRQQQAGHQVSRGCTPRPAPDATKTLRPRQGSAPARPYASPGRKNVIVFEFLGNATATTATGEPASRSTDPAMGSVDRGPVAEESWKSGFCVRVPPRFRQGRDEVARPLDAVPSTPCPRGSPRRLRRKTAKRSSTARCVGCAPTTDRRRSWWPHRMPPWCGRSAEAASPGSAVLAFHRHEPGMTIESATSWRQGVQNTSWHAVHSMPTVGSMMFTSARAGAVRYTGRWYSRQ
jgi:hypothetical protein